MDREDLERKIKELAASSRTFVYGSDKADLKLIKRYLAMAEKIVESKVARGEVCDEYETVFSRGYHTASSALCDAKKSVVGLSVLPSVGGNCALREFAELIVGAYPGVLTRDIVAKFVETYNSSRSLCWSEICNLRPALNVALLERLTVYASKIVKRREILDRVAIDAALGRVDVRFIKYDSYVKLLCEKCDERNRAVVMRRLGELGIDAERAAMDDEKRLASYVGGVSVVLDCLRSDFFSAEFLLSLSSTAAYLESETDVDFSRLTANSKAVYMREICAEARRRGVTEPERARQTVSLSRVSGRNLAEFVIRPPVGKVIFILHILSALAVSAGCSVIVGFFIAPFLVLAWRIVFGILSFPIFLCSANGLYLFVLGKLVRPRFVPEYAVTPASDPVAVICCRAISNAGDVRDALRNIETVACANPQPYFSYGLLLDVIGDYATASEDITRCYAELKNPSRFFVCLRKKAWERKRGAILQFNALILRGESEPFRAVWGEIRPFELVVTLDADSMTADAERLVGIMLHPYNANKTIMNLNMRAKVSSLATPFSRFMCGDAGISHYDVGSSDVVWNAYGFGNYTGKGIYRTKRFNALLENAFPDGRVLSHDLIEGAFAGCGNSGISGIDEFPLSVSSYMSRLERWMRGDVQLLPWLKRRVKTRDEQKTDSPVRGVAKWQIIMNALGVLSPVCTLVLLILMPIVGLYQLLAVAFSSQLMRIVLAFNIGITHPCRVLCEQLRQLWWVVLMPTLGLICLGVLVVTPLRMLRGKNLLKWSTYSASSAVGSMFAGNLLLASYYIAYGAIGFHVPYFIVAAVFLLIVPLDFLLSFDFSARRPTEKERAELIELARVTWLHFEEILNEKNGWLPCDNFQEGKGWAERTSPTNIGMAMSSAVCACEIGLISEARRDMLLGKMLEACGELEKYEGCPYNWYETGSGRPLEPRYVSSVDCGNMLAALLLVSALGGACGEAADRLIDGMNMSFMYDAERGLLRIGYNVSGAEFDAGHYDLLGSEAALTYLVSIGCGKLPREAYARLSRRSLKLGKRALASWTGGMFEYMLPLDYFSASPHSLVGRSARAVAEIHRRHAERSGSDVLGMSESLYGETNDNGDYRYKAFGVGGIALTAERSRSVFAPYAAIMSLCSGTNGDCGISTLLTKYRGPFGLYDSVDLESGTVQKSTMTHHQGMIMLTICNRLTENSVHRIMRDDARVRAAAILLEETAEALLCAGRKLEAPEAASPVRAIYAAAPRTQLPQMNYLTNGEYYLAIDECGRNYQMCRGTLLSRFDRLSGLRVFAVIDGAVIEPAAHSVCRYDAFSAQYRYDNAGTIVDVETGVVIDENAEFRKITVRNASKKPITMSVITAIKPCLTSRDADLSHKAFSSMFIETSFDERRETVLARRTDSDNGGVLALFADSDGEHCGDERFLRTGRGVRFGSTTEPLLAFEKTLTLDSGEVEFFTVFLTYGTAEEIVHCKAALSGRTCDAFTRSCTAKSPRFILPRSFRDLGAYLTFARARINGGLPGVSLSAKGSDAERAVTAIRSLKLLRDFGAEFYLVVFYDEPISYFTELSDKLSDALAASGIDARIVNELTADPDELARLKSECVDAFSVVNNILPPFYELPFRPRGNVRLPRERLETVLGLGGFNAEGEYVLTGVAPSPWCNVLADGRAGCVISDKGGFTFASNSRQEKLTRHSNDELNDEPGDGIVIGEGGTLWSVTRNPLPRDCDYSVRHGFGYSEFACGYNAAVSRLRVYVDNGVKYYDLTIEDALGESRELDVMCFAELVLGDHATRTIGAIRCLETRNCLVGENGALKLFLSSSEPIADRAFYAESFRDRSGTVRVCTRFENVGCTPALAYSVKVSVPAFGTKRLVFALSPERADTSVAAADSAFARACERYSHLSVVESDDPPLKYYLKWLAYQTLVARFTAKCGFQQVGGAIGFRDQLQDAVALIGICPDRVRAHIIDCAAHQFESGDVMHWWHSPAIGVRTRICDDRLFLPYAMVEYVEYTGDNTILTENVPYLKDRRIPEGEQSIYAFMEESRNGSEPLIAHAVRAVRSVRLSPRGLVLMGSGDWNDGMDKVGERGYGESVWCTMFMYYVIGRLTPYLDDETAHEFMRLKMKLYAAVRECSTGDRYARAFDDDGNALGVEESEECKIDALAQSWAVLSGIATGSQARTILLNACERLVDLEHGIIRLLDPPFEKYDAGYISQYPAGVRENGGQYTHAAVWLIWALYEADLPEKANELLEMILPSSHTSDIDGVYEYLKEPYVLAGDVYAGELAGRAGWTWYTGAAGWLYRLIVEKYYGVKITSEGVRIMPALSGKSVRLTVRTREGSIDLTLDGRERGRWKTFVGGRGYECATLPLGSLVGKSVVVRRQKLD